jgi:hypothetical protein
MIDENPDQKLLQRKCFKPVLNNDFEAENKEPNTNTSFKTFAMSISQILDQPDMFVNSNRIVEFQTEKEEE